MMRITLLACLIALFSLTSALADDDWAWEDLTEVHVTGPNEEDAAPEDESAEPEPVGENAEGEALNFGAYFGNGDEFVNSNVAYNKDLFITITDVDVDAHSGNIDALAYSDDGSKPALPESDVEVENNSADRPDNVFGPLYGVPDDAVGLNEYRSEDYSGMEPGDEDVVEEAASEAEAEQEEETVEPESFVGGSLDSAIDDARPADEEELAEEESSVAEDEEEAGEEETEEPAESEEGEESAEDEGDEERQRQNRQREKRKPEEWWNEA